MSLPMTTRAHRKALAIGCMLAALGALLFGVAPSQAYSTHKFQSNFNASDAPEEAVHPLVNPLGLAVDDSGTATDGTVYVGDVTTNVIDRFNAGGEYVSQIDGSETPQGSFSSPHGISVEQSTGDLYVADSGHGVIDKFGSDGKVLKSFGAEGQLSGAATPQESFSPTAVAIDPQIGDLYVADSTHAVIDVFNHGGEYLRQFASNGDELGLAIDSQGNLFAANGTETNVYKTSTGELNTAYGAATGILDSGGSLGVGVDPANDDVYVADNEHIAQYDKAGKLISSFGSGELGGASSVGVGDSAAEVYTANINAADVAIFGPLVAVPDVTTEPATGIGRTSATLHGHVSLSGGSNVTGCYFEYGTDTSYNSGKLPCSPETPYSSSTDATAEPAGLKGNTTYHYRLVATNSSEILSFGQDETFETSPAVAALSTEPATQITDSGAQLNASFLGSGEDTQYYFEWGTDTSYGNLTAAPPGADAGSPSGPQSTSIPASISGLSSVTAYDYRVVATNSAGTTYGANQSFITLPNAPLIGAESATEIHSDTALIHVQINPGGGKTAYHVEYTTQKQFEASEFAEASQGPSLETKATKGSEEFLVNLSALTHVTTYHYRVVATNADNPNSPTEGAAHTFTTLPFIPSVNDQCPNAHVRQQTGAAQLLDCRAYELVSAANTGGYDVESNVVPGQSPFAGYPDAEGKVLYGVHNGGIAGTNNPTNKGLDPYVATRGPEGWSTEYVGIPANDPEAAASNPFSSTPTGADASLETFAFGGPGGCSPCFSDGSTGIPIRKPNGELIQGMAGPENPGPSATADGHIAAPLSANGEHFIFGSTSRFARGGNNSTGDVSIYDRNLKTGETSVVSNTPRKGEDGPEPLPCVQGEGKCNSTEGDSNGTSELAISKDGSHVLLGQKVSEDSAGHPYYHLYMEVNDGISSIDLTPEVIAKHEGAGFKEGVLFDGMTEDGSKVFFTTKDALHTATNQDTDESADLYLAEVSGESSTLTRISTGTEGTGNTDSCDPAANSAHEHWNVLGSEENCGVLAIGGSGGVAKGDGTVYFLSPEKLDGSGNGTQNAPNLYVARPGDGYVPHYVTTLESILTGPQPPVKSHNLLRKFGSLSRPSFIAVDDSPGGGGDVYVADTATSTVFKFDPAGELISSWGNGGRLKGDSTETFGGYMAGIAVDSAGTLYVMSGPGEEEDNHLFKFGQDGNFIEEFKTQFLDRPAGIAVDNEGNVYKIRGSGDAAKLNPSGEAINEEFDGCECATGIAVDQTTNDVYVDHGSEILQREPSGTTIGSFGSGHLGEATGLTVSPANHDVFAAQGNQVIEFEPSSGTQVGGPIGTGVLLGPQGLAADSAGDLFVANDGAGNVAEFGPPQLPPSPSIDNPLVVDAVSAPETARTADFQVSPNGAYAAFPSALALAGGEEETAGHRVLYRYDASSGKLSCVSCTSTGAPSEGDSGLAEDGLSLLNDGRVFFNSTDQLVSADTDGKQDVYEFSEPVVGDCNTESTAYDKATGYCLALISAGTSPFDSGLLSASANGTDVYFFTRDSLAPQDKNGNTMKIYDAREGGGFAYVEPEQQCQASDECHGAASPAPGPANIGSITLTPGNVPPVVCRKASVAKHGRCVPKHGHKKRHHKQTNNNRGGAK